MFRRLLRSNVAGYLALFVALGGTAMATQRGGTGTIDSQDIIDGQVMTTDISNSNGVRSADVRNDTLAAGGLAAVDLAPDSVDTSELVADSVDTSELVAGAVGTNEIGVNEVLSRNIALNEVNGGDIANDAVSSTDIASDGVRALEIAADAVGTAEIATNSVGAAEIASDSVGSGELDSIHEHRSAEFLEDAVARDGNWAIGSATVSCATNEELLSVSIDWGTGGADVGVAEKMLANVPVIDREGVDSATVEGAFDGGGGDDPPASYEAVATCMAP